MKTKKFIEWKKSEFVCILCRRLFLKKLNWGRTLIFRCPLDMGNKKSIFSIGKANNSQLFLPDKLVSGEVYNAKNIFWIATLYRKIGRKITFDFENFEVNYISNGGLGFQFDTCFSKYLPRTK
jgi:hypothetical protein